MLIWLFNANNQFDEFIFVPGPTLRHHFKWKCHKGHGKKNLISRIGNDVRSLTTYPLSSWQIARLWKAIVSDTGWYKHNEKRSAKFHFYLLASWAPRPRWLSQSAKRIGYRVKFTLFPPPQFGAFFFGVGVGVDLLLRLYCCFRLSLFLFYFSVAAPFFRLGPLYFF